MVKWVMFGGAPVVLVGGMYLHGPLKTAETYARTPAEAAFILETLQVPEQMSDELRGLPDSSISRTYVPGESLTLAFNARGKGVGKFVAEMKPVDENHVRVSTSLTLNGDAEKVMKGNLMTSAKRFKALGGFAMQEHLDAKMEKRPFDKRAYMLFASNFEMANLQETFAGVAEALNEHAAVSDRMSESSGRTVVPGRPMVDVDRSSDSEYRRRDGY